MSSPFDNLSPDLILDSIEALGYKLTGEMRQLNSYENRVFQIATEDKTRIVAKYYRPGRWSLESILEEHEFMNQLALEGLPVVNPILINKKSAHKVDKFIFCIFPFQPGRMPDEFKKGDLISIGERLARLHNIGSQKKAKHRPNIFAKANLDTLYDVIDPYIFPELKNRYQEVTENILDFIDINVDQKSYIRIHGDCHRGNILHNGNEFYFVDFDDFCNGPAIQDFWLLIGDDESAFEEICEGYSRLREIPDEWHLVEALRGMRIITYAAWIASRWGDDSFKKLFPQFQTYNYWLDEVTHLETIERSLK